MKKNKEKLIFGSKIANIVIATIISCFVFSGIVFAINTVTTGYKLLNNNSIAINAHTVCKDVINTNSGKNYFIPTKTSNEWLQFRKNTPSGVLLEVCPLKLTIQNGTFSTNLRTFIDANNPGGATKIQITNNGTIGSVTTGDLTGLDVRLINNGEIQGNAPGATALTITSPLKLTNNGWIRGAGGNGGKGGNGTPHSRTVTVWGSKGPWSGACLATKTNRGKAHTRYWDDYNKIIHWSSSDCSINNVTTSAKNASKWGDQTNVVKGGSPNPAKRGFKSGAYYSVFFLSNGTNSISSGIGGNGGIARYFNHTLNNGTSGSKGVVSGSAGFNSNTGFNNIQYNGANNKGGNGGNGGDWGETGGNGGSSADGNSGLPGGSGGKSITGTSKLKTGSVQGNLSGGTSN